MTTHSEDARQWVHVASASFALLLRWLLWWQAAGLFAGETGIRPRGSASDYPAQVTGAGATLGAAVLSPARLPRP